MTAVCYVKSRSGSTTTALGVTALLPEAARAVVVECDPAGGDLTLRHGLRSASPGLVELATATRTGAAAIPDPDGRDVLSRYAQPIHIGDRTVEVVLADCGRLDFASPTWPLLSMADAVVVLTRGRVEELGHLREHVGELVRQVSGRLVVMLAVGGPYCAADVEGYLHRHLTDVLDQLAADLPTAEPAGVVPAARLGTDVEVR